MARELQIVKPDGPAENVENQAALTAFHGGLPSIVVMRQRMTWMTEFRALLVEYVQTNMDPTRHMYTFANGGYKRIADPAEITAMLAKGQKPALNQDGIHNLLALFEADIEDQQIEEWREEGFYTCRVTLRLRYFGSRSAIGMGSCSTRESKYAYRWVYERDVPRGIDKAGLKAKAYEPEGKRPYTRYRLDNDDLADVEATVLQMAIKRAKSSAVKSLPGVSEMFATLGDPDEEAHEGDAERQVLLRPIGIWLKSLKVDVRVKATQAIFGEPLSGGEIAKLDEERLAVAAQRIAIATQGAIDWESATLAVDLRSILRTSAAKSSADLFGDDPRGSTPTHSQAAGIDLETGEVTDETTEARNGHPGPKNAPSPQTGWRRTIEAHLIDSDALVSSGKVPPEFTAKCLAAFHAPTFSEKEGNELAMQLMEWVDVLGEEGA